MSSLSRNKCCLSIYIKLYILAKACKNLYYYKKKKRKDVCVNYEKSAKKKMHYLLKWTFLSLELFQSSKEEFKALKKEKEKKDSI